MGRKNSVIKFKVQHAFFDIGMLVAVILGYIALLGWGRTGHAFVPYSMAILFIWLFTLYAFGGYDYNRIFKISHNFRLVLISSLVSVALSTAFSLIYPKEFTVLTFNYVTLVFIFLFYSLRLGFTKFMSARFPMRNCLIYGASWAGHEIHNILNENKFLKFNVVGYIDDDESKLNTRHNGVRVLGSHEKINEIVDNNDIDTVIFAITRQRKDAVLYAKSYLEEQDINTVEMPNLYEQITGRVPVLHVNNTWHDFYVSLKHRQPYLMYRTYNILLASFFTLVFLPVIPLVALAIKLTSKGPILYSQTRVGKKEKLFTLYKFRSMRVDAEKFGAVWAQENDPRLTPIGGFLRKTRLDEIPQLINVFRGEMNFVGPRPERPKFVTQLNKEIPFYRSRHQVAPGLTGWAQVMMGYVNSVDGSLKKLQFDLYYVKNRNIFLDLLILLKTVQVVLTRKGT